MPWARRRQDVGVGTQARSCEGWFACACKQLPCLVKGVVNWYRRVLSEGKRRRITTTKDKQKSAIRDTAAHNGSSSRNDS